ncbi:actinia tenebrosa protease inhibitors-like [Helicoverpa zea]|uniref:actinia tenebrosa protease inhibitors-like n=1 Tax=Helicoverpa zea TaxID=7113 RepID=UPI001F57D150|nr:actinia tenebrosa protease inhibitors-like [Helicoverpa zea]
MKSLFDTIVIFGMVTFCESSVSSQEDISASAEITLTTAKDLGDVSPKPTSLYRRINVERIDEFSSTPLDLFRVREPQRRSHMDSVWKWDFWCQLQPKIGKCSDTTRREQTGGIRQSYYYDAQLDTCLPFAYSGCDGNKNNFPSLIDCERHCKGSSYMTLKDSTRTTYCALQPNAGLCMSLISRYYYDVNVNDCKVFVYGGCGGNQNRFTTYTACKDQCIQ